MSWEGMLLLMWRGPRQRNKKAEVALGKLREVVFLKMVHEARGREAGPGRVWEAHRRWPGRVH